MMRIGLLICVLFVVLAKIPVAQETATLTTSITPPTLTKWYFDRITETFDKPFTPVDESLITLQFIGDDGRSTISCSYTPTTTPSAKTVSDAQNKRDFSTAYAGNASTGSRKQAIYHRLVVIGDASQICGQPIVGSLSGSVP